MPPSDSRKNLTPKKIDSYIGRFAPSPTGPLHFGSLVAALASYLDARHHNGQWLLRIEDLDPPREQPGATEAIIRCLGDHQLHWDGDILYQSQRLDAYTDTISSLRKQDLVFPCTCTRKALAANPGPYPGTCRHNVNYDQAHALRLRTGWAEQADETLSIEQAFDDLIYGHYTCQHPMGDFIVQRKDGLFAYQLAVVVDDIFQNISHVVRGVDLIDSTPSQHFLFSCLNATPPQFAHIPMALNNLGQKLSKQHGAPPIANLSARQNIIAALGFLNHTPDTDIQQSSISEILQWAIQHWDRKKIPLHDAMVENAEP